MKLIIAVVLSVAIVSQFLAPAAAAGAKTHGDACNFLASGFQIFSKDTNLAEACDTDKNLVCALNKCTCLPGSRWEQNFIENVLGVGGICVNGARVVGGSAAIALFIAFLVNRLF